MHQLYYLVEKIRSSFVGEAYIIRLTNYTCISKLCCCNKFSRRNKKSLDCDSGDSNDDLYYCSGGDDGDDCHLLSTGYLTAKELGLEC